MRLFLLLLLMPSLAFAGIVRKNAVLDTEFTGTMYIGLFSSACTDSVAGTELSGNGYARQSFTMAAAASGTKASTSLVTFTASGGNWSEVTHYGIYDAVSGGTYKFCGTATPNFTLTDGNSKEIAIGNITVTLD